MLVNICPRQGTVTEWRLDSSLSIWSCISNARFSIEGDYRDHDFLTQIIKDRCPSSFRLSIAQYHVDPVGVDLEGRSHKERESWRGWRRVLSRRWSLCDSGQTTRINYHHMLELDWNSPEIIWNKRGFECNLGTYLPVSRMFFWGETCRGRTFCEIKHERSIEVIKIVKGEGLFVFIKMISMKEKKKKTMLAQ